MILFLLKPVLLLAGPIVLTIRSDGLIVGYDFNSQTEIRGGQITRPDPKNFGFASDRVITKT